MHVLDKYIVRFFTVEAVEVKVYPKRAKRLNRGTKFVA